MTTLLPKVTLAYLQNGAPKGERHNHLLSASCQYRDAGIALNDALRDLGGRAARDGLLDHEWQSTIRGVYSTAARKPLTKGESADVTPKPWTAEEKELWKAKKRRERLQFRAGRMKSEILSSELAPDWFFTHSPVDLAGNNPADDWRLLLSLFSPEDVIWIGGTTDSCNDEADDNRKARCRLHFRRISDWLFLPRPTGQFTCPSVFKAGCHSRCEGNVVQRRFLVLESDTLTKPEIGAVFRWMRQFVRLRAIVDTAGKSLHGWFDVPEFRALAELKVILPVLGCDPALFKAPQPVRLPGALRDEKYQTLLYLDL